MTSTVPCGAMVAPRHKPTLASVSTKSPPCRTCCAVTTHCTLTQGCGTTGANGQPTIVNVSEARRIGALALPRVEPGMAMTVPPCGQVIVLAAVSSADIT